MSSQLDERVDTVECKRVQRFVILINLQHLQLDAVLMIASYHKPSENECFCEVYV
jgi:hypothetical protein